MTQYLPGTEPELDVRPVGECTSVVVYNPSVYDLSIEVDDEPPEPKIYDLPENGLAFATLIEMHTFKRPHGSRTEKQFIRQYIQSLGEGVKTDIFGNYWYRIGDAPVMWSSHTDTVHSHKGRQSIGYDGDEIGVAASDKQADCLGADDTAGVWLMLQMIAAKRPGLYVFHRGEEKGCLGSKYITKENKELVDGIKFAIALDRKGTRDVITHQRGKRTCSDDFAKSMADQLGMGYMPDNGGIYTDTAEYTDLIGECTNISVGYRNAHGQSERLDCSHIFKLRDALLKLDWEQLVEKRKPGESEYKAYQYSGNNSYHHSHHHNNYTRGEGGYWSNGVWHPDNSTSYSSTKINGKSWWERQKEQQERVDQIAADRRAAALAKGGENPYDKGQPFGSLLDDDDDDDEIGGGASSQQDFERMVNLVRANPEAVADLLEQFGYGPQQLAREILDAVGICAHGV